MEDDLLNRRLSAPSQSHEQDPRLHFGAEGVTEVQDCTNHKARMRVSRTGDGSCQEFHFYLDMIEDSVGKVTFPKTEC